MIHFETQRASGRTTRLVDYYIQELFTKGSIHVRDHHDSSMAHKMLRDKILQRLDVEHRGLKYIFRENTINLIEAPGGKVTERIDITAHPSTLRSIKQTIHTLLNQ